MRLSLAGWILGWAIVPSGLIAAESKPKVLGDFLAAHCFSCHNAENKQANLNLEELPAKFDDPEIAARWVRVHDRVRDGEMPPPKKTRPPQADLLAVQKLLSEQLIAATKKNDAVTGRSTVRRLNRTEYENTLRDLFDLPGLEIKDMLPDDGRADGFDKSARALDVSPILLSKYAEVADRVLDMAIAQYSIPPEMERKTMYAHQNYDMKVLSGGGDVILMKDMKYDPRFPLPSGKGKYGEPQFSYGGMYKGLGEAEKAGVYKDPATLGMFRTQDEASQYRFAYAPVNPGRYTISVSTWSFWWDKGEVKPAPRTGALGIYLGGRLLAHVDAPSLKPTTHELNVWFDPKPRDYIRINPASNWNVHLYFRQGQAGEYTGPGVAIDSLTVTGPIYDEWPPASHQRLFGDLPVVPFQKLPANMPKPKRTRPVQHAHDVPNNAGRLVFGTVNPGEPTKTAERLLKDFLPKAFRRPVGDAEVAPFTALAINRLSKGDCFEDAMRSVYKTILCSPDFLFHTEPVGQLDDYAVANRLSYFLWNSMPDETLTQLAAAGKLRTPEELRRQTDRLLADPKGDRFITDFLDQWLDLKDIDATSPDKNLYPEFGPYLRDAIAQEPAMYFKQMLKENRTAREIVDSKFAILNQRLAEHYGIPGVDGNRFRFVHLPADSPRGGFLTQAAVLKVTANGTTTSPVKRGAWVQRKIVGKPPEPPPPMITAVEPDVRGATTIREQLAKHRDNASCASCHAKMDPPGFALESFDPIGSYREKYRATAGKERANLEKIFLSHLDPSGKFPGQNYPVSFSIGQPVDASGETSDGKKFQKVNDFKTILVSDARGIARQYLNQLVAYSTSSPVRFADRSTVEQILDKSGGNFPVRSLIQELVNSPLFLNK